MPSYSEIEAFIIKWTFFTIFGGVISIFILKTLGLFTAYFASGKAITDVGSFIWKVMTQLP